MTRAFLPSLVRVEWPVPVGPGGRGRVPFPELGSSVSFAAEDRL